VRAEERLAQLADLWRRERAATQARFAAERDAIPLAERVARGLAMRDLAVEETAAAAGGRLLLWLSPRRRNDPEPLRLGTGDPVRLWIGDDAVLATCARRRGARVAVMLDVEPPDWVEAGGFHLDREAPQATFDRGDRAIQRFRQADGDRLAFRAALFGEAAPGPAAAARAALAPRPFDPALHEAQLAAVALALSAPAPAVTLVHGPPGTGKTRTLVEIVRQLVARGERVLCAAASNTAVDNLAERLAAADVPLVRLGHPARVAPAVEAHTLDAELEAGDAFALTRGWLAEARDLRRRARNRRERGAPLAEVRELQAQARHLERDARAHLAAAQGAILARARAVCATAAGADAAVLGDEGFDVVVLDEATQAPDPIALCALLRGRRAVLAGDPCQLPPTVIDSAAASSGLARTLFENLAAAEPDAVRLLVVQHRMHQEIMAFPSASKYGGRLVAAPEVAAHRLEDLGVLPDPLRPGPFHFVDTAGKGWSDERGDDDPSTRNPAQAARVAAEARRLLARGLPASDLAVIAPYDAQVRLLRDELPDVEVGTVDGFQGREKEAVIVDLVRSNDRQELGFLADTRRMNVALTRARRFLLVVGDSATLGAHRYYAAFLAAAERAGAWLSAWADDAPTW
jgi:ATP-dependent RNA/DNA helicase IGHMBP2